MKSRIMLISDTHSVIPENFKELIVGYDELWHAGDIGHPKLLEYFESLPLIFRSIWGNIDGAEIRRAMPEKLTFSIQGLKFLMIHIGGYPGKFPPPIKTLLDIEKPNFFICGHSHIVKAMPDKERKLFHLNPGAMGLSGWHKTLTYFELIIENGKLIHLNLHDLGSKSKCKMLDFRYL